MPSPVIALALPGSAWGSELRALLAQRDLPAVVLEAAPPVRIAVRPGRVRWNEVDLLEAGAIFLERPEFPWPQPAVPDALPAEEAARRAAVRRDRETRSLMVSALAAASEVVPTVNPSGCAHLAASPASALERAARAGVPVRPWRLTPSPDRATEGSLVLDAVGRDRRHAPQPPPPGDPALVLDAPPAGVEAFLVAGSRTLAVGFPDAGTWLAWDRAAARPREAMDTRAAAVARRAAEACGLSWAHVAVVTGDGDPHVLYVDAAPDLPAWNAVTAGAALTSLAEHLAHTALRPQGALS